MKCRLKMKFGMMVSILIGAAICIALVTSLAVTFAGGSDVGPVTLTVQSEGGNKSSPFLYGIMFEVRGYSTCSL